MLHLLHLLGPTLDLFARGGGGGSGGGGGGGGSGGGGGGGVGGIAAIGYFPAHFVTQWCYKKFSKAVAIVAGIVVLVLVTAPFVLATSGLAFLVGIGAVIGIYSGLHNWLGRLAGRITASKKAIQFAASTDPAWQEQALKDRISKVWYAYQQDWSTFNLQNIQTYTTQEYFQHNQLMLTALHQMGRRNEVGSPRLLSYDIIEVNDRADNTQDNFNAFMQGQANDQLIDTTTNQVLYTDNSQFSEFWRFNRNGDTWVLSAINQTTANVYAMDSSLQDFAKQNGMFYSLDWGWLLLPQRGQLFGKASFKKSDINNHVIGNWNGLIVQLYTYIPAKSNTNQNYLIGQITLPKSYGGIIVKRRSGGLGSLFGNRAPRGYQKVSMEWPDFNQRWNVFATDMDKVTSFELLNPKFMADLYDQDLKASIEVVDNVVYLHAPVKPGAAANQTNYPAMLGVLQAAFRELRR